jgi:hypothetical protein
MSTRFKIIAFLAAAHLALVFCGAAHLPVRIGLDTVDRFIGWYGAMSGSETSYGFYSPTVAPQTRATFTLTDSSGRTWTDTPDLANFSEANLRFANAINLVYHPFRDEAMHSWATYMLRRHPSAVRVKVLVEYQSLPYMAGYAEGDRPLWHVEFDETYERSSDAVSVAAIVN